jgi:hypothetical protein
MGLRYVPILFEDDPDSPQATPSNKTIQLMEQDESTTTLHGPLNVAPTDNHLQTRFSSNNLQFLSDDILPWSPPI